MEKKLALLRLVHLDNHFRCEHGLLKFCPGDYWGEGWEGIENTIFRVADNDTWLSIKHIYRVFSNEIKCNAKYCEECVQINRDLALTGDLYFTNATVTIKYEEKKTVRTRTSSKTRGTQGITVIQNILLTLR
jgi:hypothetical protein